MKKRFKDQGMRKKVGGFDLVYHDGPVKHEGSTDYISFLGSSFMHSL
jgi:hypothetical protein